MTSLEKKQMKTTRKKKQKYPVGWDEERIRKLAEHYDNQTEDEQVAEHEAAFQAENQTVMAVPTELVPEHAKVQLLRSLQIRQSQAQQPAIPIPGTTPRCDA